MSNPRNESENDPNILFLLTDQQRHDAVGYHDGTACETPAIDELAASGTQFTRAYTPTALCSPARGSLMTGLYPHNHGLLTNKGNFNSVFQTPIQSRIERSYPQLLAGSGYELNYVGKWHLPEDGERWGFDDFSPQSDYFDDVLEEFDYRIAEDEVQRLEWGGDAPFCGTSKLPAEGMQEAWVADQTIRMIDSHAENDEEPFALCASFRGPHFPYAVPEPYDSMYDPGDIERPDNFDEDFEDKPRIQEKEQLRWNASHLTWPDWQNVIAHYWGYCTYIDDQIGRILDRLDRHDMSEETVILFASDHGSMLGNHRLFNKGMNMYEETHRVPLIISHPNAASDGKICDEFVNLVDLMPTMLELGGTTIPGDLDGRSLVPFLSGDEPDDWFEDVFAEFHGYESSLYTSRMIRTDSWKYVYNPASRDELYDMKSDPGELNNLADDLGFNHVLRRMKNRLVDRMEQTGDDIADQGSWQGNAYDLYISDREK